MVALVALIVFIALPGVLGWAFMRGLAARAPRWSRRRRMVLAALGAGVIPVLPALAAVGQTYGTANLVPIIAVFILGLIVATVVGLPSAWLASRGEKAAAPGAETFE